MNNITHRISDRLKIPEKESITAECSAILAVSTTLSSPSEIESSTILHVNECLRRMKEISVGNYEKPTLKNVTLAKFEGNASSLIAAFGKPTLPSRLTKVESSCDEPKEGCKEPPVPRAPRRLILSPTLIDEMKLCYSNIEARPELPSKRKKISPPPKQVPKRQKGILRSSSIYPVPKLGRQSPRKTVTAVKPIDDGSLNIFRTFIAHKQQCEKGSQITFPEWKKKLRNRK